MRAAAATTGAREVVILLDRSASMGYGDHWTRAQDEARKVVSGLGGEDRATLVLFDRGVEEAVRATSDRGELERGDRQAAVSVGRHALRAGAAAGAEPAEPVRPLPRKEAFLISDFQKIRLGAAGGDSAAEGARSRRSRSPTRETSNLAVSSRRVPARVVLRTKSA